MQLESLVKSLESEKRFKPIFTFRKSLGDSLKKLRITQRIIFSSISDVYNAFKDLKQLGTSAGILFSSEPPVRINPSVPKPLVVILHIEDASNMFPLPEFTSTLSNTSSNIPEEDLKLKQANEKPLYNELLEYRRSVSHQFLGLFNSCASTLNSIDDKFSFYSDMYGHVDGTFRDLVT